MKIIETEVPDVNIENIDTSKVELSNKIIQNIFPLFDEILESKLQETKNIKSDLKYKRIQVYKSKESIEAKINEFNRFKKVKKLLERISKLVTSGLVFDPTLKHETVVLLKIIDKLPNDKIDYHIAEITKTINKRFAKI